MENKKEIKIADHLMTGAENAQTGKELCTRLDIPLREVAAMVEDERRSGAPICASQGINAGYFLAADKAEMETYIRRLESRKKELKTTITACAGTINDLPINGEKKGKGRRFKN